jgi:hypothetical protein
LATTYAESEDIRVWRVIICVRGLYDHRFALHCPAGKVQQVAAAAPAGLVAADEESPRKPVGERFIYGPGRIRRAGEGMATIATCTLSIIEQRLAMDIALLDRALVEEPCFIRQDAVILGRRQWARSGSKASARAGWCGPRLSRRE